MYCGSFHDSGDGSYTTTTVVAFTAPDSYFEPLHDWLYADSHPFDYSAFLPSVIPAPSSGDDYNSHAQLRPAQKAGDYG
jgi:hypothetical protein